MLKKQLITGLIIFIQAFGLTAQQSRFKENETLNVWAASGLNMRDKPEAKSTKVATIPYGARVTVQPNIGIKIPFEVEEFKGFTVKGYWLLVKYGNTEGFVFDGFLSRLPAPNKADTLDIEGYLDKKIEKIGKRYEVKVRNLDKDTVIRSASPKEDVENFDYFSYKQKYKQGILYEYLRGEGGFNRKINCPNLTLYEGYVLVKTYFYDAESHVFSFDKKDMKLNMFLKESGAGCEYDIKQVGNKIIIDGGCGC